MHFKVIGKEIYYSDKVWINFLRIIPKDENFIRKIIASRNKIPKWFIEKFNLTDEDKKEYDSCNTEQELAEKIIADCKKKGVILVDTQYG